MRDRTTTHAALPGHEIQIIDSGSGWHVVNVEMGVEYDFCDTADEARAVQVRCQGEWEDRLAELRGAVG